MHPSIQEIKQSLDKEYGATDNYGLTILDLEKYKENIYQSYNATRDQLKKKFFKLDSSKLMDENLIDIHKIAACFCMSMLDNKIFVFEMKEQIPVKVMLCNYALALNDIYGVSFDILVYSDMMFWIEDYNKKVIAASI